MNGKWLIVNCEVTAVNSYAESAPSNMAFVSGCSIGCNETLVPDDTAVANHHIPPSKQQARPSFLPSYSPINPGAIVRVTYSMAGQAIAVRVSGDPVADRDFTGQKENRELGLLYYNARYYVPGIGRFASADTIVPDPANPQSYNRFSYVQNNPVLFIDPTGHYRCQGGSATENQACYDSVTAMLNMLRDEG